MEEPSKVAHLGNNLDPNKNSRSLNLRMEAC
jgi:hypothetical protein